MTKKKKKLTVKQRILNALVQNRGNGFLPVEEITRLAYGDAYLKETKKYLVGLVKRNMSHTIALASDEGLIVLPLKEPSRNGARYSRHKVLGYKIVGEEDQDEIIQALVSREERVTVYQESYDGFLFELNKQELLTPETKAKVSLEDDK